MAVLRALLFVQHSVCEWQDCTTSSEHWGIDSKTNHVSIFLKMTTTAGTPFGRLASAAKKLCQQFFFFFGDALPHNKSALPVMGSGMRTYFAGMQAGSAWGEPSRCSRSLWFVWFFCFFLWACGNFWECLPRRAGGLLGRPQWHGWVFYQLIGGCPRSLRWYALQRMRDSCTQIIMERWVSIVRRRWDLNVRVEMCESQEVNLASEKVKDERKAT